MQRKKLSIGSWINHNAIWRKGLHYMEFETPFFNTLQREIQTKMEIFSGSITRVSVISFHKKRNRAFPRPGTLYCCIYFVFWEKWKMPLVSGSGALFPKLWTVKVGIYYDRELKLNGTAWLWTNSGLLLKDSVKKIALLYILDMYLLIKFALLNRNVNFIAEMV